ncbi:MAG: ABC transporter ATP-binding protein [Rhodospirillales bacterium]|nr:ABC transporter ATP-binding protein [Rhodospirillales bacterium]
MIDQFKKIYSLLDRQTRVGLAGLFGLIFVAALLEMAGISMFVPLLHILSDPAKVDSLPVIGGLYHQWADGDPSRFIVLLCSILFAFFVAKNIVLALIIYCQNLFVLRRKARFAHDLMQAYLERPYVFHLQHNTSELVRNVTLLASRLYLKGVMPFVNTAMELLTAIAVLVVLMVVDPGTTLGVVLVIGLSVAVFYRTIRHRVREWGARTIQYDGEILLRANQALGSIKETKISGKEAFFADAFWKPCHALARYMALSSTASHLPRLFIEAVAMGGLLLLVLALIQLQEKTVGEILPTLGIFGVAAMRLMPSFSKIVSNITLLRENMASVDILHDDLRGPEAATRTPKTQTGDIDAAATAGSALAFKDGLRLEGVSYRYPGSDGTVLDDVNLTIPFRRSVALVGQSGAGKTTLVDVILGLLEPTEGSLTVDGESLFENLGSWQRRIGYIPQDIYLTDDTLRNNIALGVEASDIDPVAMEHAVKTAHLEDFINSLPKGLDTILGERGTRFSGGQRQRVGIARALYHDPEILVMDEATSALDSETENRISQAIDGLSGKKTVIVIAHRLSTVRNCDRIVFLEGGQVIDTGTFDELAKRNANFNRMVELSQLETPPP